MKNIKWHKFGLVAFLIWFANGSINIISGPFRTYFAAIMMFLIIITMSSCSTTKYSYSKTRQKVERMTNPHRQFIVVNNQIIMFENS